MKFKLDGKNNNILREFIKVEDSKENKNDILYDPLFSTNKWTEKK